MADPTVDEARAVTMQQRRISIHKDDPYRSHMYGEAEKDTQWRHGAPPQYDMVNKLFELQRRKVWEPGSLEGIVQNLVKTWEMELSHKTCLKDFKTLRPETFRFYVNGNPVLSAEQTLEIGSYNALLSTDQRQEHDYYKSSMETFDSSHDIFRTVFPKGFAWEVLEVYSGPPVVAFKWRHWGVMEGGFKGHAPTGEVVESIGVCIAKVDIDLKIMDLEIYYDPAEFLRALTKGPRSDEYSEYKKGIEGCPFSELNLGGSTQHISPLPQK
eukprot:c26857_g1_i1 orf=178-984(-)